MTNAPLEDLVRNFPENGPKLLLENAANVRELLVLLHEPKVPAINFKALTVERSHFVQADYGHVALDLLLKAPLQITKNKQTRTIFLYLLLEHQSKPQRFFLLRLLEYILEVYKMQKRPRDEQHSSDAKLVLQPVLPVVLYTGQRRWGKILTLADVIEEGDVFAKRIPTLEPHFLNLRDTDPQILVQEGGSFGQVLRLIRERHGKPVTFRQTLEEVVSQLESMPEEEHVRWREFLSYIMALVYHSRGPDEQPKLRQVVEKSIITAAHREEFANMGQTIADMYMEKGREEGKQLGKQEGELEATQKILLRQLHQRFKNVPVQVEARVAATTNLQELQTWLDNILKAKTLAKVGIPLE